MAQCKYCKVQLKWKQPYTRGDRPVELSGKDHNCPNYVRKVREPYGSYEALDMTWRPIISFCGKCGEECECEKNFDQYCKKCEMYPSVTFNSNVFKGNPNVKPLQISNDREIFGEYRGRNDDAPTNWMHMKVDGTMKEGYPLTKELTKWYDIEGKDILEEIHSNIWYKKKERNV